MKNLNLSIPKYGVWSKIPAEKWEFAMLTGNGEQGALDFGNHKNDTIILTNEDLFLPMGNNEEVPNLAPYLEETRKIIREKNYTEAIAFSNEMAHKQGHEFVETDPFHPGLVIHFDYNDFDDDFSKYKNYKRTENFYNGEIGVSFQQNNTTHVRKMFVSRNDDLIAMNLSNSSTINCDIWVEDIGNDLILMQKDISKNYFKIKNSYVNANTGYDVYIKVLADSNCLNLKNGKICISNADEITVLLKIKFWSENSNLEKIVNEIDNINFSYEQLLERHEKIHSELFMRTELEIGESENMDKCIEELFEMSKSGSIPMALHQKIYEVSKYMVISCCGKNPPNLHGLWTGTWKPMWSGDFTVNTNVQLAIEGLLSCGYTELLESFFHLIETYTDDYEENAMKLFGCRGMLMPSRISNTGKSLHYGVGKKFPGQFWTCGLGWACHWYYLHYTFTGDITVLKERGLPLMKAAAKFYEDFLTQDPSGYLRFSPSFSAENGLIEGVFTKDCMSDNSTQDIAVTREFLTNLINICELIGDEDEDIPRWKYMLEHLPPYLINDDGVLQEWAVEGAEDRPNHRHYSQLYSIFEHTEFDPVETPELWTASEKSFEQRLNNWLRNENVFGPASHGKAHAALSAVRFGQGDVVDEILNLMVTNNTYFPNLIASNFPDLKIFNVDMTGAMLRIVNDSIAYARKDKIYLVSALPKWEKGTIKNIRLDGQVMLKKLSWSEFGAKIDAEFISKTDKTITFVMPNTSKTIEMKSGITEIINNY